MGLGTGADKTISAEMKNEQVSTHKEQTSCPRGVGELPVCKPSLVVVDCCEGTLVDGALGSDVSISAGASAGEDGVMVG